MWRLLGMRRNDDDAKKTRELGYFWLPMDDEQCVSNADLLETVGCIYQLRLCWSRQTCRFGVLELASNQSQYGREPRRGVC
jgi:hypothetical protein